MNRWEIYFREWPISVFHFGRWLRRRPGKERLRIFRCDYANLRVFIKVPDQDDYHLDKIRRALMDLGVAVGMASVDEARVEVVREDRPNDDANPP